MSLQDAADRLAIIELASAYENAFDRGDLDAHMATWADAMRFDSPFGSFVEQDAYRGWLTEFKAQALAGGGTRHLMTNHEIELDGDTATMTSYLTILNQTEKSIINTAVFTDQLVRGDEGWRFAARRIAVDGVPTAAEIRIDASPAPA